MRVPGASPQQLRKRPISGVPSRPDAAFFDVSTAQVVVHVLVRSRLGQVRLRRHLLERAAHVDDGLAELHVVIVDIPCESGHVTRTPFVHA